jgi:hypothetical protein
MSRSRQSRRGTRRVAVVLAVFAGVASVAGAQVATGPWTSYTPGKSLQKTGNVYYSNSGGVETFRLNDSSAARSEIQLTNRWSSGSRQFEGHVRCTGTARSSGNSVQQVMQDGTDYDNDMNQVRFYSGSGGTLGVLGGSTLATGIYGVWVRINTVHYTGSKKTVTYANGSLKSTLYHPAVGGGPQGTYYFKYGIYIAGSSGRPQAEWRGIRTWYK